jgi:hypothetical protein
MVLQRALIPFFLRVSLPRSSSSSCTASSVHTIVRPGLLVIFEHGPSVPCSIRFGAVKKNQFLVYLNPKNAAILKKLSDSSRQLT